MITVGVVVFLAPKVFGWPQKDVLGSTFLVSSWRRSYSVSITSLWSHCLLRCSHVSGLAVFAPQPVIASCTQLQIWSSFSFW
jgi:hypothetical protein